MNDKVAAALKLVLPLASLLVVGFLVYEGKASVDLLLALLAGGGLGIVLPQPGGGKLPAESGS